MGLIAASGVLSPIAVVGSRIAYRVDGAGAGGLDRYVEWQNSLLEPEQIRRDLFVDASSQAGWNNPAAEAMACGVPLICTDIGGVRDFASDGETALLVPPGDVDALAAAILRAAGDDALRSRLAAAGLKAIARFDWDRSADRLVGILERALEREPAHV